MGRQKHLQKINELFGKSPVVTFSSIQRIVQDRKASSGYAKQLVRNMVLAGKIQRLAKGCYTKHSDPSLCVLCLGGYLGLQDSLSLHNLWEQETIPIIVTPRQVRQGIRKILGTNVLVRRIDKKYLFGFYYKRCGEFFLPVSDIEKTFIDLIYFNEKIGADVLVALKKSINKNKLKFYLKWYPKKFRGKVLNELV